MNLVTDLRGIVGAQHVRTENLEQYEVDWTRVFRGPAIAVVAPATTAEVAAVIELCGLGGVPVVPQGGNTGLVGGAVPDPNVPAVILRSERLIDPPTASEDARSLTVGAGVTLAEVQREATRVGRYYGVDLAARDQATIGGTVATNAGGVRVCAYGMTRQQVLGLEFVLADGSVISDMVTLPKDNTGYDLSQLVCGSEGTLGIITKVAVKLLPKPGASTVFALPVADLAAAQAVVAETEAGAYRLLAAEICDANGWRLAARYSGFPAPFDAGDGVALLVEIEDAGMAEGVPLGVQESDELVVATDLREHRRLWELREGQTEVWSRMGLVHKFDVSLPSPEMDAFVATVRKAALGVDRVSDFGFFGHIADGNLHLEVVGDDVDVAHLTGVVLGVVSDHGGSISAEHGVGRAKAGYLALRRSDSEIETMRRIKSALDPQWTLNPGVLLSR
jgi:FAD/FMN-containing dehydrogenase